MPEKENNIQGMLLDIQMHEENGKSAVDVFVRTSNGIEHFVDKESPPYFYITPSDLAKPEKLEKKFSQETFSGGIKLEKAKTSKRGSKTFIQLFFKRIPDFLHVRERIVHYPEVLSLHEYNIPYVKRYLIDKQIIPFHKIELMVNEKKEIQSIRDKGEMEKMLRVGAFDIETYSTQKMPFTKKDPIISISIVVPNGKKVFIPYDYEDGHTVSVKGEKELLESFNKFVNLADLDVLCTYNGDQFDFPFIVERAQILNAKLDFGFGNAQLITRTNIKEARLRGIQHLDVYQLARLLSRFQALKAPKLGLGDVMQAVFGEGEKILSHEDIISIWDTKENLETLSLYNLNDSIFTRRLAVEFMPLLIELSQLVGYTLFDVNRSSASQLVEATLIRESFNQNKPIPNTPTDQQVRGRMNHPIEGGYVKEPVAGLHEHIAVLDFRSIYPSIMIAHNISPETLDCRHKECREGKNKSPTGHWFCTKERGLVAGVLERILDQRIAVQEKISKLDKKDPEAKSLKARKQALKILLNSFFGTLAYPRFRWYSRESARAITAWARHYIKDTIKLAEEKGLQCVYGDTDSNFLLVPEEKGEKEVMDFVNFVNQKLKGKMELEFEGLYKRGLFVTKKEGRAAKKRYALAGYDGELNIVGFEYVRRDWSKIARETQKKVLQYVLVEGEPEKAVEHVTKVIQQLKNGKVPKKDLVVLTRLQQKPEKYSTTAPHVAAVIKARQKGRDVPVGSLVGFIITAKGKSISEKARMEEFVEEGEYDAEYYIQNQIIPSVIKILSELGYTKTDLERGGKQTGLEAFV
jgi:DNA polymerase I